MATTRIVATALHKRFPSLSDFRIGYLTVARPEAAIYLQVSEHSVSGILVLCSGWLHALSLRGLSPRYPALHPMPGRSGGPAAAQGVSCASLSARALQHLVSKEELCAHVWPAQFISDATIE